MYIVQSKVKDLVKQNGMRASSEFLDAISRGVAKAVALAVKEAKDDRRMTLKARDVEN